MYTVPSVWCYQAWYSVLILWFLSLFPVFLTFFSATSDHLFVPCMTLACFLTLSSHHVFELFAALFSNKISSCDYIHHPLLYMTSIQIIHVIINLNRLTSKNKSKMDVTKKINNSSYKTRPGKRKTKTIFFHPEKVYLDPQSLRTHSLQFQNDWHVHKVLQS